MTESEKLAGHGIVDAEIERLRRSSGSLKGGKAPGRMVGVHFIADVSPPSGGTRMSQGDQSGGTPMTPDGK